MAAETVVPIHPDPDSPEVWVVTGASRGIGAEMVKQLLERGAHVAAGARNPGASAELTELAKRFPKELKVVTLDVASADSIKAAAAEVKEAFPGGIQYIVNMAGHGGSPGNSFEVDPNAFRECLDVNVIGPMLMFQSFVPLMTKAKPQPEAATSTPEPETSKPAEAPITPNGSHGTKRDPEGKDKVPEGKDAVTEGESRALQGDALSQHAEGHQAAQHPEHPNGHVAQPSERVLRRAVINISSNLGSSLENYQALHRKQTVIPQYCLDYRASKAALNASTTVYAAALRKWSIWVVAVHPGWVATEMGLAAAAGVSHSTGKEVKPPLSPTQSSEHMLAFIDRLEESHTGRFFFYDGREHDY